LKSVPVFNEETGPAPLFHRFPENVMKINLTIDATPEEVRRALGLPVMNDVHQAVMDQMSDQVKKGTVDPEKVMEMLGPSMKAGQQIMETFLKGMGSAMETASTMEEDSKKKSTSE